jgi:lactate dehydrogenase-like 2-hydroxyacid dehydrogenase
MAKPDVIVLGDMPAWDSDELHARFNVQFAGKDSDSLEFSPAMRSTAAMAFKGFSGPGLGAPIMDALPGLKLIANYGVGYDSIDMEAARARGIRVTNTPDVLTGDVADLTVGLMLAVARDLTGGEAWLRRGDWGRVGPYPLQRRVFGKRAGIVGLGRIGAEIARRLGAFDMQISYWSRGPKPGVPWRFEGDLVALARAVDFLVIALAGGPETRGLVSGEVIRALGPKGTLINISRGTTLDEGALLDALESGALGWAALDVFLNEPNPDPRFLVLPNVHLQPHVASATEETRRAMGMLMIDNISAFHAGRELLTEV